MKKTAVTCPQCGKNNLLDSIGDEITTISCKKCGSTFEIQNLLNNVSPYPLMAFPKGFWFYKHDNGDIRIAASFKKPKTAIVFLFLFFILCITCSYLLRSPDIFDSAGGLFTLTATIFVMLEVLYLIGTGLFGRAEFCISHKGSYLFLGFYKVGLKKRFSWNRINKIYCECDYSSIFYRRTALCLQEKKLVRIGYIGSIFAKEYELSFLESALNFLFKEKYKVSGGI